MRRRPTKGWDDFSNPVPGNVYACLEELGVEIIRQTDDEILGRCPGHVKRTGSQDKHPSWSVNAETGVHNCFSCGYRGTFVRLVMDVLDVQTSEAVGWIRQRGSIERARNILDRKRGHTIDELAEAQDTTKVINEASLALFTEVPDWALKERGITRESAETYGLLWDQKRDHWILPIRDASSGTLMGWQEKGDRFFRNRPRDVKKSQTLFGALEFQGSTAILMESPLDVVRLHSLGIQGGLAAFGVHVSDAQMRLVRSLADSLVLALDDDRDGAKLSKELREQWSHRIHMRFFNYGNSGAKDPGEMTDEQIFRGIDSAISSILVRF